MENYLHGYKMLLFMCISLLLKRLRSDYRESNIDCEHVST